jgi:hypothetical protein
MLLDDEPLVFSKLPGCIPGQQFLGLVVGLIG